MRLRAFVGESGDVSLTFISVQGSMIINVKSTVASNGAMQDAQHLVEIKDHVNSVFQLTTEEKHQHESEKRAQSLLTVCIKSVKIIKKPKLYEVLRRRH